MSGPLPCGADPADLLTQVCAGEETTEHQRTCPSCRAVLAEDRRLWAPLDALAAEPVAAPVGIVAQAVNWVRAQAGDPHAGLLALDGPPPVPPPDGGAWVAARVVLRYARHGAEQVAGVRVALSHLADGPATALVITVVADYGQDLHALADRVFAGARAQVAVLGVTPASIAVHIDDVLA